MALRIRNLPPTTLAGERLNQCAIAAVQETVQCFSSLSRSDLVRTVCEQLGWHTPDGTPASGSACADSGHWHGMVRLPPKPLGLRGGTALQPPPRGNFRHSLSAVEQELESLFPQAPHLWDTLHRVIEHTARGPQRERPGQSYLQRSRRPSKKWRKRRPADPPPQTESHLFTAN